MLLSDTLERLPTAITWAVRLSLRDLRPLSGEELDDLHRQLAGHVPEVHVDDAGCLGEVTLCLPAVSGLVEAGILGLDDVDGVEEPLALATVAITTLRHAAGRHADELVVTGVDVRPSGRLRP